MAQSDEVKADLKENQLLLGKLGNETPISVIYFATVKMARTIPLTS